ncbi:MAG: M20/M25/M40 family metallo-hydrolase [Rhodospirillales bacterium]|nr:M20/M25/M40 family metallo-hydrolase [Rhodospirillales bacterium]MDE2576531.1 M20/M25/M40 family metallo-hydrolase [Rhodospirillales bacterium]
MDDAQAALAALMNSPAWTMATASLSAGHERMVADIVTLTEIPSPPFGEETRAAAYLEMLRAHGLEDVERDAGGNVMGLRRGAGNGGLLVVAAHLDTVFPAGTDVTVRREGTKLFAPGIGDDTRGLAVLLAFIRALDAAAIRTRDDILFVGDVGEEGLGDLRGMRHLFGEGKYRERIKTFITVDSPEMESIAIGGIGSKRLRVFFRGPGGHSFGAHGIVNPMYAMAHAMLALSRTEVPARPRTTYAATVAGGGTSINAIPNEVWMDVDLRSQSAEELARLERHFRGLVDEAVAAENRARRTANGAIAAELRLLGDRPAGATAADHPLVRGASAAIAAHGFTPRHEYSSTDANIAMSLGIPAIKIGSGGSGGRAHSLEEWVDVEPKASLRGMAAGLAALVGAAGYIE